MHLNAGIKSFIPLVLGTMLWNTPHLLHAENVQAPSAELHRAIQHHTHHVPPAGFQAPGFYRFKLGNIEVTALSDGTVPQQMDQLFAAPAQQVQALFREHHQTLPAETSMNAFLLHTGQQLLLVDTGAGHSFGPHVGNHLLANMRAAGYAAKDVDAILLTHIHGDHSGGLIDVEGRALFPNATVYVSKAELDYWFSDQAKAQAAEHHKPMFDAGRAALLPYVNSARVHSFEGEPMLFDGIRALSSPGHTPGHTFYQVQSDDQTLVIWGDVVHAAEVQFPHPEITIAYDANAAAAAVQRQKAFADAAQQGYWVAAPHLSFPGIGHVRHRKGSYEWLPAPYSLAR